MKVPKTITEEFKIKLWAKDIDRIAFLFREYNEETCSKKNPYDFKTRMKWIPIKEKDGKEHVLWDIVNDISNDIAQLVHEAKTRDYPEDLFCVPTRNGCHIMCAPFNRSKYPWLGKRIMSDAMTLAYMPGGPQ